MRSCAFLGELKSLGKKGFKEKHCQNLVSLTYCETGVQYKNPSSLQETGFVQAASMPLFAHLNILLKLEFEEI